MRTSTDALPRLVGYARVFATSLGILLGVAILSGYGEGWERAHQAFIQNLTLNCPIVATCILLLTLAALARPNSHLAWRILAQAAIGIAVLLILSWLSDAFFDTAIVERATPFGRIEAQQQQVCGWTAAFRIDTAAALLMLACGELLLQYRHIKAAQISLFLAGATFLLQLIGYAGAIPAFHQTISLFLGLAGLATILVALSHGSSSGFLREYRDRTAQARWARRTLLWSTFGGILISWLFARFLLASAGTILIGQALIFITWIWVMVTAAVMRANRADRERCLAEASLLQEATTDSLTGLLSRNRMDALIAQQRRTPLRAAMLMIDIDRFPSANNALGTDSADGLLLQVAKRLTNLVPSHDVARAGGDEFAIFCDDVGVAEANRLAEAVVETVAVPFRLNNGRQFHITASVGVAHGATEGVKDLRDAADEAMFIAKHQGGNQSVSFVSALHQARVERVGLEQDLHRAFESNTELFLVYQPIISLRDRRIVAVEALARWQHPQAGLIPPGRFVAIAEAAGMFLGLGTRMRELAVAQAAAWRDQEFGRLPVINLNVSPLELARSDVPGSLGALIDRYGLQRSSFCLEVTEGSFADERALQSLRVARNAGFKIAMDDFGVGYSSLTQLPRLPLTSVKLDRSFLDQAMESEDGISLLATMVQLAHVLKLPVVAEGVETPEELNIVSDCGCDSVQGFFFARPLAPTQLEPWLRRDHQAQARPALAPTKPHG